MDQSNISQFIIGGRFDFFMDSGILFWFASTGLLGLLALLILFLKIFRLIKLSRDTIGAFFLISIGNSFLYSKVGSIISVPLLIMICSIHWQNLAIKSLNNEI